MKHECTYCGCDIERHDPVFVNEGANQRDNQTGQFCNYGCLAAYFEREELAIGTTCELP
ncbi:hypothetical protein ACFQJC_03220 [Haloferax namakaokahaiae]|uniref:MYM-type domain-containing protein n=1 Tax=Haloferax namakaokahaiae TaxID=1748331 RepID=A0ABD5ZBT0_9EURY